MLSLQPLLFTNSSQCSQAQGSTSVEEEECFFCFVFFYIKNNKKQNKTMLPGTRQHKCGVGGGVHTKISRPTASLKEGQYFTSHCLPVPILPCHTACFSQFVWRWGSLLVLQAVRYEAQWKFVAFSWKKLILQVSSRDVSLKTQTARVLHYESRNAE